MTRGVPTSLAAVLAFLWIGAAPLAAQWRGEARWTAAAGEGEGGAGAPPVSPAPPAPLRLPGTTLRIAKWTTLLASAGIAAYGFQVNGEADGLYADLEAVCNSDPDRCASRHGDGSFADQELEDRYQRVLSLDRRARIALVTGQLGLAASVLLFVLDIDADAAPPDIPYVPVKFEASANGVALQARVRLR